MSNHRRFIFSHNGGRSEAAADHLRAAIPLCQDIVERLATAARADIEPALVLGLGAAAAAELKEEEDEEATEEDKLTQVCTFSPVSFRIPVSDRETLFRACYEPTIGWLAH